MRDTPNLSFNATGPAIQGKLTDTTRDLADHFQVFAPSATTDYNGIKVGFMQTASESSSWDWHIAYPCNTPGFTNVMGDNREYSAAIFAQNDNIGSAGNWYNLPSVKTCSYLNTAQATYYDHVNTQLTMNDTPKVPLPELSGNVNGTNCTFQWGSMSGTHRNLLAGSSSGVWLFEDMLTAVSYDCPGVYVPIYGYFRWQINFNGYYDTAAKVWTGGGVIRIEDHISTGPELSRSSTNTLVRTQFTHTP